MKKAVAVFCGSSKPENNSLIEKEVNKLAELLNEKKIKLVYGGAKIGLMGSLAKNVIKNNGDVIGVIPKVLKKKEIIFEGVSEMHVVSSMHQRKKMMYDLADFFIVLPGGIGTLEELAEIVTWKGLKIIDKKIFLLNINGFYDNLLKQFDVMKKNNFLHTDIFSEVIISQNISELKTKLDFN
jgi:uncharacterized protein (TIGR00730 family)